MDVNSRSLLSVKEAASYLIINQYTVYRLRRLGILPSIKRPGLGVRFRKEDLDAWLSETPRSLDAPLTLPDYGDRTQSGGPTGMPKGKTKSRYSWTQGAIYQRRTKKGIPRWYLDFKDATGRRIQRLAPNAVDPEDAMRALEIAVKEEHDKALGLKQQHVPCFSELGDIYLRDYAKVNKRSWLDDDYRLKVLKDFFGDRPLEEITPQLIEQFRANRLEKRNARATVNRYMALLKRMFSLAIEWGFVTSNPAQRVRQFSEHEFAKERILTPAEEVLLLRACHERLKPIVIAALNTGMRRGELLALRWEDIDLRRGLIRVKKSKSGKQRTVPVNESLKATLQSLPLFGCDKGSVFEPVNIQACFEKARQDAGFPELRFHDLRHTFATRLVDRGVDIITIQKLLGHSTVVITQRYTHARDDRAYEAVAALDAEPPHICDTGVTRKRAPREAVRENRAESVN